MQAGLGREEREEGGSGKWAEEEEHLRKTVTTTNEPSQRSHADCRQICLEKLRDA